MILGSFSALFDYEVLSIFSRRYGLIYHVILKHSLDASLIILCSAEMIVLLAESPESVSQVFQFIDSAIIHI